MGSSCPPRSIKSRSQMLTVNTQILVTAKCPIFCKISEVSVKITGDLSDVIRLSCAISSLRDHCGFACSVVVITSALNAGDWALSPIHPDSSPVVS